MRRMERAGVPRTVAMKISGHKTESIYRRYAIVAERDIADGLRKVAAFQKRVARAATEGQMRDSRVPSWCLHARKLLKEWWPGTELNRRHADLQGDPILVTNDGQSELSLPDQHVPGYPFAPEDPLAAFGLCW